VKIGLYNQPSVGGINGVENCVVTLAQAFSDEHEVEIVHHARDRTTERLEEFYGVSLDQVVLRSLPRERRLRPRNPVRRYRNVRDWLRAASEPYDLFMPVCASMPPYCHAPKGALIVVFPLDKRIGPNGRLHPWRRLQDEFEELEWKKRLGSYQLTTTISEFSSLWIGNRWGVDSEVVYAPAEADFPVLPKEDLILSVGRFATGGTVKNQLEMMELFRDMSSDLPESLGYYTVGPLGRDPAEKQYFERVSAIAAECGGTARHDLEFEELSQLYAKARIFWHAAGFGTDPEANPDLLEHFGIVTVEAMAAGCVPLVIDRGGQPEIVEHGVSGFVWNTLAELRAYTLRLLADDALWKRMSEAARHRSLQFDRRSFVSRVTRACEAAGLL
jgi:glycosyltransferase involved in cell wall biosynthesis